jgi:hypothetical protein
MRNSFVLTADSRFTWFPQGSVPMEAFVCLACGYVGHFISNSNLEKLRNKVESMDADFKS